jgi:hypothetical protein
LAWLLSTARTTRFATAEAVRLVEPLARGSRESATDVLDTLAAAYAEAGHSTGDRNGPKRPSWPLDRRTARWARRGRLDLYGRKQPARVVALPPK